MSTPAKTTDLKFGYNYAELPEPPPEAFWGARLIHPSDLVYDRQDMVGPAEAKAELQAWLDPPPEGVGGIAKMKEWLDELDLTYQLSGRSREEHRYEDEYGVIVANTNGSGGYVYVVAWRYTPAEKIKRLKARYDALQAEIQEVYDRGRIPEKQMMELTGVIEELDALTDYWLREETR